MYKLRIESEAQEDLKKMIGVGGEAKEFAVMILSFLDELSIDQRWLGLLLDHKHENDHFSVSQYLEFRKSHDIWRIKVFEWDMSLVHKRPIPYRVIYAYDSTSLTFRILAIANRDLFNYESDNPITQRVLKQYDALGLKVHTTFHPWGSGGTRH